MHEVDLKEYNLRTDLIIEKIDSSISKDHYENNGVIVDDVLLTKDNKLNKKEGHYITITFKDITDSKNYNNVLKVFIKELNKLLKIIKIKEDSTCLIIGLGNKEATPDALGNKTLSNIIVTRHMYLINDVDFKYRNVSILEPNVVGMTGIESSDIIESVIEKVKPDFIIAVDSLCAMNIERLNKTIQITDTGISPGSGIGNNKKELSKETLGIPVIAIGVATVVDSIVIVSDTINYLMKKISYLKENMNNNVDKLKPINKINYMKDTKELNIEEKKEVLGQVGMLKEQELRSLIFEVLSPINANMVVTTKDIDYLIDKMGKLLGESLNKVLHNLR